jgi:phenylacetic acid degradation operon negative regulatory protein
MRQKTKELTFKAQVLILLLFAFDKLPRPFEGKTAYFKRQVSGRVPYHTYLNIMNSLERRGWLKIFKDDDKQFIQLTKEGVLEALFIKARLRRPGEWDKKWRMLIFDIPEEAKRKRNQLRQLLKINGYAQIQKSVYINPYPLNKEALRYLHESRLDRFIRIFRIDQVDDDKILKKLFSLK